MQMEHFCQAKHVMQEENELAVHAPVHGARKTAEGEVVCISLLAQATKGIRLQL